MMLKYIETVKNNGDVIKADAGKITLTYGDTLRMVVGFKYRGPAVDITIYGSIGKLGLTFDEKISNAISRRTPNSPSEFADVEVMIDIPITEKIDAGSNYDLMAKVTEYRKETEVRLENVVDITGLKPTFTLIQDTVYPLSYIYDGETEVVNAVFRSDPFTPSKWNAEKLAVKTKEELEKDGRKVLELKAYTDITPLLWTDYRIEIRTTLPPVIVTGIAWWAVLAIILASIGLVIAVEQLLETALEPFQHKPISEEVLNAMSRETLISGIQDFEEYLGRSMTPTEELSQMSDQELRNYFMELAEAIAPSGGSWLTWLAVGGAAALGVGALIAFGGRRKK